MLAAAQATQVAEWVTMDCSLWALPPMECMAMHKMPAKLVWDLECALVTLDINKYEATKPKQAHAGLLHSPSRANTMPRRHFPRSAQPASPIDEPMPTAPEHPSTAPAQKSWLTDCIVYSLNFS